MNIFILTSGRAGSVTFIKACQHIKNYSSSHESRSRFIGAARMQYPKNHIEADNRLSWLLGRLDKEYGNNAFYVYLKRDSQAVANSYLNRYYYPWSIIYSYREGIIMGGLEDANPSEICIDYCNTINSNIDLFLRDKTNKMVFNLENAKQDFQLFWEAIDAVGDFDSALMEWDKSYNKTIAQNFVKNSLSGSLIAKLKCIARKLQRLLKSS